MAKYAKKFKYMATVSPETFTFPQPVLALCERLRQGGKKGWIVGGSVRDLLRGVPVSDYDIATDARPEEVKRLFPKVIPTGIEHGTVTVLMSGTPIEVTTLRGEGTYTDGRRPDAITFLDDIKDDLARRDFTVNAIAYDPVDGQLIDPWGGQNDLESGVLRAVGDAETRFREDGLRVLRAARFVATLGLSLDPPTERAIGQTLDTFRKVSPERVREEWLKTMKAKRPSRAFDVMRTSGILSITCPELMESVGCEQNRYHAFDVWGHAMSCLDACDGDAFLRVSALLHDVGKPRTRAHSEKTSDWTFYEHERVGADMADGILQRLKFSNQERERIVHLVRHHLICYEPTWSDAAVRRWLRRVGVERVDDLYELARADAKGKGKDEGEQLAQVESLRERATAVLAAGDAITVRALAITGGDLIKELSLSPGRRIGILLEALLEQVTDDPTINTREELLARARTIP
jgi:tRNA nucleotidyltransferase (CCA-adding enzyme)